MNPLDVQQQRDRPPTTWSRLTIARDVTEIDPEAGIYAQPSLDRSTENPAIWHWCAKAESWLVSGTRGHTLVSRDPLHLEPSLLWACCGMHGWIRDGRWQAA
jgi:hypothetical protein